MPQVEVSFDIDANGIVNVTAKDKKTGKEQKVEIKAGPGLSEEEIQKMVADAEANREEDQKFHELVQARNQADGLIHMARSTIKEHGEKRPGEAIGAARGGRGLPRLAPFPGMRVPRPLLHLPVAGFC